ncbi:retron St85 family effector protein [Thorsellia anophelis]|uniref:Uncharacterized protein n=1 Tax=Thorsellia anophelis DSM 18579 TaxID=1123402 RepID=A0A1I0CWW0_9GAMM|nr:retron St85 family effector protein [Thorsellia anophelis]SET24245.1 hypothetical protein SAMN02583745_01782 [Thorsellia anophelis DSM 18579]
MSKNYEECLIDIYELFDYTKFTVLHDEHKIFLCGGLVRDIGSPQTSFRGVFHQKYSNNSVNFILAEEFKDYDTIGKYKDLFVFENDIAHFSSLILIFLESPGSLVELGLFCANKAFYKKIVVIIPTMHYSNQNSFICLGPLQFLKGINPDSVLTFPWNIKKNELPDDHIITTFQDDFNLILAKLPKTTNFDKNNNAHLCILIYEIISLGSPISISEIELSIMALKLDIETNKLYNFLYLLKKFRYIDNHYYSSTTYYYPLKKTNNLIKFGTGSNGTKYDRVKLTVRLKMTYTDKKTDSQRKRYTVANNINQSQS